MKSFKLGEPFGNNSSFVALYNAIRMIFDFLYPFTTNSFLSWRERGKLPSIVSSKCLKLILHGRLPRSMFGVFVIGSRFRMRIDRENNISKIGR